MRKPLAIVLTLCMGALSVGCDPATKPAEPKVPKSALGAPAKPDGTNKPPPPAPTTPAKP